MMRIVTDELTAELNPKFLPSMANVRATSATLPAILKLCTFFAFSRRLSLSQHRIIDFPLSACQIPTKTLPDHNSTWFSLVLMRICCLVRWKTCASFRFTAAESTLKCCLCFNNVAGKLINFPPHHSSSQRCEWSGCYSSLLWVFLMWMCDKIRYPPQKDVHNKMKPWKATAKKEEYRHTLMLNTTHTFIC